MENVLLIVHLILALVLIAVVLLQRSEGGGLGIGGGGGSNVMSGRSAGTALSKTTWVIAAGFIATSLTLTILATQRAGQESVIDRLGAEPGVEAPATGDGSLDDDLEQLLVPPPVDDPDTPPAAE